MLLVNTIFTSTGVISRFGHALNPLANFSVSLGVNDGCRRAAIICEFFRRKRAASLSLAEARSRARAVSFCVSASKMSLNVWMLPSAVEIKPLVIHSPATPETIKSQPRSATTFAQSGTWDSRKNQPDLSIWMRRCMEIISYSSSGASKTRPTTTPFVENNNQPNHRSLQHRRSPRIKSSMYLANSGDGSINPDSDSDERRAYLLGDFFRFLAVAGVVFLVVTFLCVWEFTIGINKSIKQLYRGNIMLYKRRYSAII